MNSGRGVFIVIEGTDGSGKGTQFKLLADRLTGEGYEVETFDFPQYEHPSSYFVREYLNGKYGSLEQVGPYTASLFYALDRFEASNRIRAALDDGKVVLANRFVGSSMAHQGTKFRHAEERRGYFIWLDNLEFEMLRIPRPTFSFVLRVPPEVGQNLVDLKGKRSYTDQKRDIHEANLNHLSKAAEVYDDMCQLFPKDFLRVDCTRDNKLMDVQAIHDILWHKVQPALPPKKRKKTPASQPVSQPMVAELPAINQLPDEPPKPKAEPQAPPKPPAELQAELDELVSTLEGDVYALSPMMNSAKAATVIAQLSQRKDDLRAAVLKDLKTIETSAWTAQLTSTYSVVENASLLLSKKLEWSRMASFVERPTRLMAYDQKDADGQYRYVTPRQLDSKLAEQYRAYMDQIFNLYGEMVKLLVQHLRDTSNLSQAAQQAWEEALYHQARELLRGVLPVAAKTDIAVNATHFVLENIITHLLSENLPEARRLGEDLLRETRKATPEFMSDQREAQGIVYRANNNQRLRTLAQQYLPANYADGVKNVQLVDVWPRNEFDLLPDMLYAYSDLPLASLREATTAWPYERKLEVFEAYIGERQDLTQRPGRALEKAHYSWDLLCDFDTFRELQRHRSVDALEWQELTPRYGYDIPKIIEEADLVDQYEACFELSLRLYSILQEAGYQDEAQYATLLGHRLRWKVTYNAREAFRLHELRTSPHNRAEVRELVRAMHERLSQIHPLLGEAMRFAVTPDDQA